MSQPTTNEITPALTRAEWANVREQLAQDPAHRRTLVEFAASGGRWDAVAAIALDGQPAGFTWQHVHELRAWAERARTFEEARKLGLTVPHVVDPLDAQRFFEELAGRIEALIPPEGANV